MWTMEQILRMRAQIEDSVKSVTDDAEALERKWMFQHFDPNGHHYLPGDRFAWNGELYKVKDGMEHDSQPEWTPETAVSLYEHIAPPDQTGDADAPIEYSGNMVLESGKRYTQDGVTYLCTRDSEIAVHHPLAALVGLYVEVCND